MKLRFALMIFSLLLLMSCRSSEKTSKPIKPSDGPSTGWIGEDTFVVYVEAPWDRKRFYLEGGKAETGREGKDASALRALSRESAEFKARETFLKSVGKAPGALTNESFMTPLAVTENYTPEGDAKILFKFQAKNLRTLVSAKNPH